MLFMLISEVFFKKENYYFLKKIKLNLNQIWSSIFIMSTYRVRFNSYNLEGVWL
jgi:hypothetical protein